MTNADIQSKETIHEIRSNESRFKTQDGKIKQKILYFTKGDYVIFGFGNFVELKKRLCAQNPRITILRQAEMSSIGFT